MNAKGYADSIAIAVIAGIVIVIAVVYALFRLGAASAPVLTPTPTFLASPSASPSPSEEPSPSPSPSPTRTPRLTPSPSPTSSPANDTEFLQ